SNVFLHSRIPLYRNPILVSKEIQQIVGRPTNKEAIRRKVRHMVRSQGHSLAKKTPISVKQRLITINVAVFRISARIHFSDKPVIRELNRLSVSFSMFRVIRVEESIFTVA